MTQIGSSAEEDSRQNDDNAILTLVLRQAFIQQCYEDGTVYEDEDFHDVGGFTVVDQNTAPFGFNWSYPPEVLAGACVTFGGYEPNDPRELEKYIYKNIKIQDYDISNLVDLLLERNKKSVRLSLESLPKDGYIIDYDGTYARYFEEKGWWMGEMAQRPPRGSWIYTSISSRL